MRVEIGNVAPHQCKFDAQGRHIAHEVLDTSGAPAVTYVEIPDRGLEADEGGRTYDATLLPSADVMRLHLAEAIVDHDGVTHLPGLEAVLDFLGPDGLWKHHSGMNASWVHIPADPTLAAWLAAYWGCPSERPANYQDTHCTYEGPPGQDGFGSLDVQANITQNGRDIVARALGQRVAASGHNTTAPGSTTITLDGAGAPGSTSQWNGQTIWASSGSVAMVSAQIISNTNASPPVLTVDGWSDVTGASASTPAAGVWVIVPGSNPSTWMALSASTTALGTPSTNTSLPSEITTGGGGLIRQQTTFAHTASAQTYTETATWTANGSDSLPVIIGSIGAFNSRLSSNTTSTMLYNTLLGTTATLSLSGDNLTITQTVTMT